MSQPQEKLIDVWSLSGRFQHLLHSPRGEVEGAMVDVDGVPAQFVFGKHDEHAARAFGALRPGQDVVVEGTVAAPAPHGEAAHEVYAFERLVSVDGAAPTLEDAPRRAEGRVARIHYARHGEPNGVVLDSGDFIHTRPEGFAQLGLQPGDAVKAEGPGRPLHGAPGQVIEARTVNGQALPGKPPRG
ncbi:hypothetical protein [Paracidovorax konjaci]|uniref:Uncharacterized protein n=1 Tax=Paracidovorax konjaci TaxID=32040 RepID=A0A1I1UNI4_9BURK|nr:hypothetical protein [Paracidovorax konjaci]SFD72356.1 hypothetical protein SAMN04489710_105176 [Paracidovorax konjaci]